MMSIGLNDFGILAGEFQIVGVGMEASLTFLVCFRERFLFTLPVSAFSIAQSLRSIVFLRLDIIINSSRQATADPFPMFIENTHAFPFRSSSILSKRRRSLQSNSRNHWRKTR
jgi:hypothetical protein